MSDEFENYVTPAPKPPKKPSGSRIVFQPPESPWSIDRLGEIQEFYQSTFKRPLPLSVRGQGSIHNRLGYDHRESADIGVHPDSAEGKALMAAMRERGIPFLAFKGAVPGVSSGPHIHAGRPSSRTAAKFGIGSVRRTAKTRPVVQAQTPDSTDDFDRYVGGEEADPDFDAYVSSGPQKPTAKPTATPTPRLADLAEGGVSGSTGIQGGARPRNQPGIGELRRADERAVAQVSRIQRAVASEAAQSAKERASGSEAQLLAQRFREQDQPAEVVRRLTAEREAESRRKELIASLTTEDKANLTAAVDQMRGQGSVSRGITTGSQRIGSGLLYKLAGLTEIPTLGQGENPLAAYLRRQAGRGELAIEEIEAEMPPDARQQWADFLTSSLGALPEIYGATTVAGPVGGFAALGGLEAAGREEGPLAVASETAKGALLGKVFGAAGRLEEPGRRAITNLARSSVGVGAGTAGVETAFGADMDQAGQSALANVAFHVGGRVLPGVRSRLQQTAERVLKAPEPYRAEGELIPAETQTRLAAGERSTTPPAEPTTPPASIPFMITRQMEAQLRERGLSQAEINRLTPQQANDILATSPPPVGLAVTPAPPERRSTPRDPTAALLDDTARAQWRERLSTMNPEDAVEARRIMAARREDFAPPAEKGGPPAEPVPPRNPEAGFIDIGEIRAGIAAGRIKLEEGLDRLHGEMPERSREDLRAALLPDRQREVAGRVAERAAEPPTPHHATAQPRAETGRFEPGAPGGPEAERSMLRTAAREYQRDYGAIETHQARRLGLEVANDDIARNYFSRLRRFTSTHKPDSTAQVQRAEDLYNKGRYSEATTIAEQALSGTHQYVSQIGGAMMASKLAEKGLPAPTNWREIVGEVRRRMARTGPLSGGGSTFYDVNKYPEGGRPDHSKIAYIVEPVIEGIRNDARRLIAEGKLKASDWTTHIRREVNARLQSSDFTDWHGLNRSVALAVMVDRLKTDGPPIPGSPQAGPAEGPPRMKPRSLPKTLERSGRDPGTDTEYQEAPNARTRARVEEAMKADGPAVVEEWFRDAPPSPERTAALISLVDHYTLAADKAKGTEAQTLRARAVELSNLENSRSTTLGQTVQAYAMLNKYTSAGAVHEGAKLAKKSGRPLTDSQTAELAKTGRQYQTADAEMKRLRGELEALEAEAVGAGPAGASGGAGGEGGEAGGPRRRSARKPAESILPSKAERKREQLDEAAKRRRAAKVHIARQLEQIEQSRTVGGYWLRAMNATRGLMVSHFKTAMRNLQTQAARFGIERLTDTVEHTLRRSVGMDSDFTYRSINRNALQTFKRSEGKAREILGEHPAQLARMFNTHAEGMDLIPMDPGAARGLERVFRTVEKGVEIANWANRMQEFHLRSVEFLAEVDLHLRKDHNLTLDQFVKRHGADQIPMELVERGVNKSLEVTFADMPMADRLGGQLLEKMIRVSNYIPPTLSPVPFGRFMFNNLKFLYQYNPTGLIDLARKSQAENRPRVVARALVGSTMLLTGYLFRTYDHAGEKWYEIKIGGTTLDARPFGPFSTYLFLGEAIRRATSGEKPFTVKEILTAMGAVTSPGGTAEAVAERLYDHLANADWEKAQRVMKTEAGEWGRAILTPVRQVKDLIAAFESNEGVTRDTATAPFLGPMAESVPFASEAIGLPPAHLPTTAVPIHQEAPATAFSGWRVQTPKTYVQEEIDTLHIPFNQVRQNTGNPDIDLLEKRLMGPMMDQLAKELEVDQAYKSSPPAVRRKLLKDHFAAIREEVRMLGEAEQPELYEKWKEDRKPRDEKEFDKAVEESPGLSSALRLGVPVPIPPRLAGEDDLAYRARLIQTGRAQRARLDSAITPGFDSLSATARRKALHDSLA